MGATGLFAYLNNKTAGAAQQITLRPAHSTHDECRSNDESPTTSQRITLMPPLPLPPRRVVLFDGNGLYHHLLYKYFPSSSRSTGGDFRAMHAAASQFLAPFLQPSLRIAIAVVFDGCASSSEGKSATRLQRSRDRRDKMKRFDIATRMRLAGSSEDEDLAAPLPSGCVELNAREESMLPVPAGCLLAFRQSMHALCIATWNADGENDEYLAALAVGIATAARDEGRSVAVDIVGQDSDFLVFDTQINEGASGTAAASSSSSSARASPSAAEDVACAYVPLESLRFEPLDSDADSDSGDPDVVEVSGASPTFSVSFRRYTTASVCAALKIPACLLPSVACLVGNDSALDLAHFHCFARSGSFHKLVRDSAAAGSRGTAGGAGTGGVSSTNRFAALTAGKGSRNTNPSSVEFNGGFNTSAQLVEAVLAFVSSIARTHGCAATSAAGTLSAKEHAQHLDAMAQVIQCMFGKDASAPPRSPPTPDASSASTSSSHRASALHAFRRAQLKYSLARFFHPQHGGSGSGDASDLAAGYGVFDPGFVAATSDSECSRVDTASTATLLPRPLLSLYHAAHFSPVLLSILLTRHYVSHVTLGDVVHPCCFHTQHDAAAGQVDEGGVCAKDSREAASDECFCRSAAECSAGVRRRVYQLLMMDPAVDLTPRCLPSSEAGAAAESGVGASVSAMLSTLGRSVMSLFRPTSSVSAAASCASTSPSFAPPAQSIIIWECIHVASVSDRSSLDDGDDDAESAPHAPAAGERWVEVELHQRDTTALLATITEALKATSKLETLPSLFSELGGKDQGAEWMTLLALLDNVSDLPRPAGASKLPAPAARLVALRSSLAPLVQLHPPLGVFALVVRQIFLHALAPLLAHRFEPPAIDAKVDATISAQMRRAIVGLHALVIQAAIMLLSSHTGEDQDPKPEYLCLEALSLSQLFMECYHWTEYAVHVTRLRAHLQHDQSAEVPADASAASFLSSRIAAHPSPLLPLFRCFDGGLFHRVYIQLLEAIETPPAGSRGGKKKGKKAAAAATSAHAASSSAAASSKSAPAAHFNLCSLSLSNALLDLDAVVSEATESVLLKNLDDADSGNLPQLRSLIYVLKATMFESVGLAPHSRAAIDDELRRSLAQSFTFQFEGEHVAPRFVLPFETFQAEPSGTARSSAEGSTFFSLCSATMAPTSHPHSHQLACGSCGLRGVDVPHPSMSSELDDGSGSDQDAESKAVSKRKRKSRAKGKSKR